MKYLAIAVLTALVSIGIEWLNSKAVPRELDQGCGRLSPSRIFMWFTLLFSGLMTLVGIEMMFSGEDLIWALACLILFSNFIYGSILALLKVHDVVWNNEFVQGPNKMFGIVLSWSQARIKWDDIQIYKSNWAEYLYVQGENGERVYWGIWYPGFTKLRDEIYKRSLKDESH